MCEVFVATFPNGLDAAQAAKTLWAQGTPVDDVCALEGGEQARSCGFLAVRTGTGHMAQDQVQTAILDCGGRVVTMQAPDVQAIIKGLPGAHNALSAPETFLPPIILDALRGGSPLHHPHRHLPLGGSRHRTTLSA